MSELSQPRYEDLGLADEYVERVIRWVEAYRRGKDDRKLERQGAFFFDDVIDSFNDEAIMLLDGEELSPEEVRERIAVKRAALDEALSNPYLQLYEIYPDKDAARVLEALDGSLCAKITPIHEDVNLVEEITFHPDGETQFYKSRIWIPQDLLDGYIRLHEWAEPKGLIL